MKSHCNYVATLVGIVLLGALTTLAEGRPGSAKLRFGKARPCFTPARGLNAARNRQAGQVFAKGRTSQIRRRIADKISRDPIAHVGSDLAAGQSTPYLPNSVRFRSKVVLRTLNTPTPTELRKVKWTTTDRTVSGEATAVTRILPNGKPMTRISAFGITDHPQQSVLGRRSGP